MEDIAKGRRFAFGETREPVRGDIDVGLDSQHALRQHLADRGGELEAVTRRPVGIIVRNHAA